jgi:UDP-glucose 4-epimerase
MTKLIIFATTINSLLQRKNNRTNMNLLIIGGAGYIGSHMVKRLLATKHSVTILDNLSTGYRDAILGGVFIQGDVGNRALLDRIFS